MASNQEHRDENGNLVGRSEEKADWTGSNYTEHRDTDGNLIGSSEKKLNLSGSEYAQHRDKEGERLGHSEERTDWTGKKYIQHYDKDGRKTGQSEIKADWLGNDYIRNRDAQGNFSGTSAGGSETSAVPPPRKPTTVRKYIPSANILKSSSDDGLNGVGFLLTLLIGLTLLVIFVYIGVPILAGVWLAKFANRRWVSPIEARHKWRWVILPSAFAIGALPANELIATGFGAMNCTEPQSLQCTNYRNKPLPTVLGIHARLVQNQGSIISSPSNISQNPTSPYQENPRRTYDSSDELSKVASLTRSGAIRLIDNWLAIKPSIFATPFNTSLAAEVIADGPLLQDIAKPGGSADWLRANNSYYVYHSSKIVGIVEEDLGGPEPNMKVRIQESSTLHSPKGAKHSDNIRTFTYAFAREGRVWKIYDYK